METSKLKKFAQFARRSLIEQVGSKLTQVLKEESFERRELPKVVAKLEGELKQKGKEQLVEQVAYVWFNRFCALRFMDVNVYNRIGVLSPAEGQFQPEILAEAKAGHIDESVVNEAARAKIFGLLDGSIKSRDGQSEAYRLLIVAVCNDYHRIMPYLFERIEDYTELLMPDDLLSGNSILAYTREAMTPEACESVECIGWLYQFYISEKKDKVFEGLKNNKKITPENIPAATQLFTPHWIVRYLVENSLGRLWMLNNPNSKVIEQMDYYIAPAAKEGEEQPVDVETDFLHISSPEEIKVCDPACGSGHMLTYSYDLLYAIYLDAGYDSVDIPELILTKNLYGIEIDERAAELAAFALSMKALKGNPNDDSNNRRRFFRNPIKPNICRLENVSFKEEELDEYIEFVGKDLFTQDLRATLKEFEEADNFGSLIQPTLTNAKDILATLESKNVSGQLFLTEIHNRVLQAVKQADYLCQKYQVVVANPPYMGSKGMNPRLAKWAKDNYPDSKSDMFAMFIERDLALTVKAGFSAMINMQSWMFLSSFEKLRKKIIHSSTINSMAHLGTRAFDSIGGEVVSTTAYVLEKKAKSRFRGSYVRLVTGRSEAIKKDALLDAIKNPECGWFYRSSSENFVKIPGCPIGYWVSKELLEVFRDARKIEEVGPVRIGLQTGDNARFVRFWWEISSSNFGRSRRYDKESSKKWFPYNKGGGYKKWLGEEECVVNWKDDGDEIIEYQKHLNSIKPASSRMGIANSSDLYFKESISWSKVSSGDISFRFFPEGYIFDVAGPSFFPESSKFSYLGLLNSKVIPSIVSILSPTLNYEAGAIRNIPIKLPENNYTHDIVAELVRIQSDDVKSIEMCWSFERSSLLVAGTGQLSNNYTYYKELSMERFEEAKKLEEENNKVFIDLYGLSNEISAEVDSHDVTLESNLFYRYSRDKTDNEREAKFIGEVSRDFVSYTVGCMFGRYSIDKKGLILASQSDAIEDYLRQVPHPSFMPDDDNVIPMIDFEGDWFEDDISERFKQFLKVTCGEEHFSENLAFIEEAIGKDIKKYFTKDFYADHVKRYKKRPIYWLFSSPKGTFNALIYMHRYRPDTVSVVLNDYLREFRTKLQARKESYEQIEISASASQKDKTQAIKSIDKINKILDEVNDYERDILYPLAGQNIEIDLDDGVKHNYPLFGKALKKIAGLS